MAQVRVPPGGSNTPFGGVGLRRSPPTQAGQSGKSKVIAAGEAAPDTVDDLTATSVQSTSEVSKPVIGQTHVLNANDVASASQVSIPVLRQVHVILANDVQSASSVSVPALGVIRNLLANDVESASAVSRPAVGQIHGLLAEDVASASTVSVPAIAQIHVLAANDVESTSQLNIPVLAEISAQAPVSKLVNSFIWGLPQGRYEDPDKPIKKATQRQKRRAVARTIQDILGIRAPSILDIAEKEAIAQAAQMLLESERLQASIDELEQMVASKLEEIAIEERRKKRNRQAAQILLLAD